MCLQYYAYHEGLIKWDIVLFGNISFSIIAIIEMSFMFVQSSYMHGLFTQIGFVLNCH